MSGADRVPGTPTRAVRVLAFGGGRPAARRDEAVVEEPLEIRVVVSEPGGGPRAVPIAVTMRTPGHDVELAIGFLVAEGIVDDPGRIVRIEHAAAVPPDARGNVLLAQLAPGTPFDEARFARRIVTNSSCGICGRTSIEEVERTVTPPAPGAPVVAAEVLMRLPGRLAERQGTFARTGGLHAAAQATPDGEVLLVREDVGRHNALDKLAGALASGRGGPAGESLVLVSGRAGFELVQKALVAGFPMLAALGAPSHLAVALAERNGMTLVGFLRDDRFNVYCGERRIASAGDPE